MRIKELRSITGLSQAKFAALFKIPLKTIQQWEQEVRTPPEYVVYMIKEILLNKGYFISSIRKGGQYNYDDGRKY